MYLNTNLERCIQHSTISHFRRYGGLDGGRFCFEGGSRCGKGEGIHVLRLDEPGDLQNAFDLASKGKLEAKRPKSGFFKSGQSNVAYNTTNASARQGSMFISLYLVLTKYIFML